MKLPRPTFLALAACLATTTLAACGAGEDADSADTGLPRADAGPSASDAASGGASGADADTLAPDAALTPIRDRFVPVALPGRPEVHAVWAAAPGDVWLGTHAGLLHATTAGIEVVAPVAGAVVIRDVRQGLGGGGLAAGSVDGHPAAFQLAEGVDGLAWQPIGFEVGGTVPDPAEITRVAQRYGEFHFIIDRTPFVYDPTGLFGGSTTYRSRDGSLVGFDAQVLDVEFHGASLYAATSRGKHVYCDNGSRRWCVDAADPNALVESDGQRVSRLRSAQGRLFGLGSGPGLTERLDGPTWSPAGGGVTAGRTFTDLAATADDAYFVVGAGGTLLAGPLDALEPIDLGLGLGLTAVSAVALPEGGQEVWIVAEGGLVLRCEGACNTAAAACTDCDGGGVAVPTAAWGEHCDTDGDCLAGLQCDPNVHLCADCIQHTDCPSGLCALGRCG